MLGVSRAPGLRARPQVLFDAKREASLDELNSPFQRNVRRRRKKHVEMIGHENELMQFKFLLRAIVLQSLEEEMRHRFGAKDGTALPGSCGHEEGAGFLRGVDHWMTPGLKPGFFLDSFHDAKAWCFHPEKRVCSAVFLARHSLGRGQRHQICPAAAGRQIWATG